MADLADDARVARADMFVSVVAVVDDAIEGIAAYVDSLSVEMSTRYSNYEILLVDNGLKPAELVSLRSLLAKIPCIRVLRLSRTFASDDATFAGLDSAIGDCVVVVSPTQDPVEIITKVVQLLTQGDADIVQGLSVAPLKEKLVCRLGRGLFYWYNRTFLSVDIPKSTTSLTGLTRRAVNTLTATSRSQRYLRHLIHYVGYHIADLRYTPLTGRRRIPTLRRGYIEAVEMISSYSTHPLRVVTVMSAFAAFANLVYATYAVVVRLFVGGVVEGWTTTSLQGAVMFFGVFVVLAVQSEYLARILTETRREPSYVIMEELESETLIAQAQRRNVSD
ncbi:MAG: glycosyltransferase [Nocardioides sp.]|nr:glycosyltransferase [Nocardioides sp.]